MSEFNSISFNSRARQNSFAASERAIGQTSASTTVPGAITGSPSPRIPGNQVDQTEELAREVGKRLSFLGNAMEKICSALPESADRQSLDRTRTGLKELNQTALVA